MNMTSAVNLRWPQKPQRVALFTENLLPRTHTPRPFHIQVETVASSVSATGARSRSHYHFLINTLRSLWWQKVSFLTCSVPGLGETAAGITQT